MLRELGFRVSDLVDVPFRGLGFSEEARYVTVL